MKETMMIRTKREMMFKKTDESKINRNIKEKKVMKVMNKAWEKTEENKLKEKIQEKRLRR
jgi:hypothetical protein